MESRIQRFLSFFSSSFKSPKPPPITTISNFPQSSYESFPPPTVSAKTVQWGPVTLLPDGNPADQQILHPVGPSAATLPPRKPSIKPPSVFDMEMHRKNVLEMLRQAEARLNVNYQGYVDSDEEGLLDELFKAEERMLWDTAKDTALQNTSPEAAEIRLTARENPRGRRKVRKALRSSRARPNSRR